MQGHTNHTYPQLDPDNPAEIPKQFHFIWVGGPIPEGYLRTLHAITAWAKQNGFKVNLWVDNESNYYHTSAKAEINVPGLRLRNVNELNKRIKSDAFYQNKNRGKKFKDILRREMVGFKNFSAASDILRYEILRQEGGYYFDTDTTFPELEVRSKKNSQILEIKVKNGKWYHGIKEEVRPKNRPKLGIYVRLGLKQISFIDPFDPEQGILIGPGWSCTSDIIAAIPDHPVMEIAITDTIAEYQSLNAKPTTESDSKEIKRKIGYHLAPDKKHAQKKHFVKPTTAMDQKRFPFSKTKIRSVDTPRAQITIEASGPGRLYNSIQKFFMNITGRSTVTGLGSKKDYEQLLSMVFPLDLPLSFALGLEYYGYVDDVEAVIKVVGDLKALGHSDQTWLEREKNVSSFDDHSIARGSRLFTHSSTVKKSAVKKPPVLETNSQVALSQSKKLKKNK